MKFVELSEHTVLDVLDERSVVVDLGMNEGRFAFQARDRYGCRVFGCEPTPALAARLQDQPGIVCDPVAVAGQAGEVEFFLDDADLSELPEPVLCLGRATAHRRTGGHLARLLRAP
jgi:hypothetical protein